VISERDAGVVINRHTNRTCDAAIMGTIIGGIMAAILATSVTAGAHLNTYSSTAFVPLRALWMFLTAVERLWHFNLQLAKNKKMHHITILRIIVCSLQ